MCVLKVRLFLRIMSLFRFWIGSEKVNAVHTWESKPEFWARTLGMIRRASAKACTPSRWRPLMPSAALHFEVRQAWAAISKAPAPGTTQPVRVHTSEHKESTMNSYKALSNRVCNKIRIPLSMAFFTARRPSRTASFICTRVCLFGPRNRSVTDWGFAHCSTNVYLSSPWVNN